MIRFSFKNVMKFLFLLLLTMTLLCTSFSVTAEDIDWDDAPFAPVVHILSPAVGEGYGEGSTLAVSVSGQNIVSLEIIIDWQQDHITQIVEADQFEAVFQLPQLTTGLTITVKGYGGIDAYGYPMVDEKTREVPSPKQALIHQMFRLAYQNSKDKNYRFAPAQEDHHIGLCKNFVM
ncbi:MAG: efflux RND transporter periplasmic adaptor subunit, partial [Clostridiales bacterium]|nr:efflux RND transporter periplasmic adaptor subunit [Clostridiales bacterium]